MSQIEFAVSQKNNVPVKPSIGKNYLVGSSPNGAWSKRSNNIANWNGTSWLFKQPIFGNIIFIEDIETKKIYNGKSWVVFVGSPVMPINVCPVPETRCTGCGALNWHRKGEFFCCDYCGSNYGKAPVMFKPSKVNGSWCDDFVKNNLGISFRNPLAVANFHHADYK